MTTTTQVSTAGTPDSATALGLDILAAKARAAALKPAVPLFYFLRHGETAGNAAKTLQPIDEPLNARGHEQARAAAAVLKNVEFTHIVASDQPRAWLTAGKVAAAAIMMILALALVTTSIAAALRFVPLETFGMTANFGQIGRAHV